MSKYIANSTQVPNAVFDEIMPMLSDAALRCYLVITRQTTGWQKAEDSISISQFVEKTGKSKPTVIKGCEELEKIGLIVKIEAKNKTSKYALNLSNIFTSQNSLLVKNIDSSCQNSLQEVVKNIDTQKPNKPTIQKPNKKTSKKNPPDEKTDYDLVIEKIISLTGEIPQPVKITANRKRAIDHCLKNYGLGHVLRMLDKAAQSPLTSQGWFGFDFMWKDTPQSPNFLKILEGCYDQAFSTGKAPALAGNQFGDNL